MKNAPCYRIQLVGNTNTVKRMIASLYLVDAKSQDQVLKVSVSTLHVQKTVAVLVSTVLKIRTCARQKYERNYKFLRKHLRLKGTSPEKPDLNPHKYCLSQ